MGDLGQDTQWGELGGHRLVCTFVKGVRPLKGGLLLVVVWGDREPSGGWIPRAHEENQVAMSSKDLSSFLQQDLRGKWYRLNPEPGGSPTQPTLGSPHPTHSAGARNTEQVHRAVGVSATTTQNGSCSPWGLPSLLTRDLCRIR